MVLGEESIKSSYKGCTTYPKITSDFLIYIVILVEIKFKAVYHLEYVYESVELPVHLFSHDL